MIDASMAPIAGWESFYVIVGSSGGALTGLQFVVMSLVSQSRRNSAGSTEIDAFATPTVVHFTMALVIAAVLSAPWPDAVGAARTLMVLGLAGVAYTAVVTLRARRATRYTPVLEDWIFHVILPSVAYWALFAGALMLVAQETVALFAIAGVTLLLLVIGIHNSWDTVTWVTMEGAREERARAAAAPSAPAAPASGDETQVELL